MRQNDWEGMLDVLLPEGEGREDLDVLFLSREKTIVALLFRSGFEAPRYIMKWTEEGDASAVLEKEYGILRRIEAGSGDEEFKKTIPRPLALRELHGRTYLLERGLGGKRMKDMDPGRLLAGKGAGPILERVADWLYRFYATAGIDAVTLDEETVEEVFGCQARAFMSIFDVSAGERKAVERALDVLRGRGTAGFPLVMAHGDFSPANIMWSDKAMGVIDWELASEKSPPLDDLYHFLGDVRSSSSPSRREEERSETFREVFFSRGPLAGAAEETVRGFSGRMGIDPGLLEPLFVLAWVRYAVRKARYITRDSGTIEGEPEWKEFWRHCENPDRVLPVVRIRGGRCGNLRQFVEMRDRFILRNDKRS